MCVFFNEQMEKDRYKNFREIFHERVNDQKIRKNAVYTIEVVQTFSENSVPEEELEAWIEANAKWLCETFGESNIIDCQGHRDQKVFHLHTLIIPLDDGKLNAYKYLGGSRHRMMELQDSYSESMKQFGLSRGISREQTQARHESTKKWLNRQAEKENRLKACEEKYGTEKDWCFDEMLEFRRKRREEELLFPSLFLPFGEEIFLLFFLSFFFFRRKMRKKKVSFFFFSLSFSVRRNLLISSLLLKRK